MSKSPRSKNKQKTDVQEYYQEDDIDNMDIQEDNQSYGEREKIRRKLIQDATDLLDYVTIEMTVGSQMESTKKNIRELSKRCREESRMINDLERQIEAESSKKDKIESGEDFDPNDQENKEIEIIHELEEELKSLYKERAALLSQKRKK